MVSEPRYYFGASVESDGTLTLWRTQVRVKEQPTLLSGEPISTIILAGLQMEETEDLRCILQSAAKEQKHSSVR